MANKRPLVTGGATGKQELPSADSINIPGGVSSGQSSAPTAWFHAGAGTSTVPPVQLTAGTNLSTPSNGAIEYDGQYYITLDGARYALSGSVAGRATGQTAANSSVVTLTVGASDASFEVSANVLVTTSSGENFSVAVDYTDEGNTARTHTMNFFVVAGTLRQVIASPNGAIPYGGVPMHIRCKASTTITIKSAGTFTGCTYNIEGRIRKI